MIYPEESVRRYVSAAYRNRIDSLEVQLKLPGLKPLLTVPRRSHLTVIEHPSFFAYTVRLGGRIVSMGNLYLGFVATLHNIHES